MNPSNYRRYTVPFTEPTFTFEFPEWTGHQDRIMARSWIISDENKPFYTVSIDFGTAERDRNLTIIRSVGEDAHVHYLGNFTGFMSNVARCQVLDTFTGAITEADVRGFIEFDVLTNPNESFQNTMYLLAR